MEGRKAVCISAANKASCKEVEISRRICGTVCDVLAEEEIFCQILELRKFDPMPCAGCGRCSDIRRCGRDKDFNRIYEELLDADYLFFISPFYAPIPAKLCMVLEKMQQIAAMHSQRGQMQGKLAGIISYGEGAGRGLKSCKAMVNDTIANALLSLRLKVVPYNIEWNTGIFLQEYALDEKEEKIRKYVEVTVQTSKSLYAIL